MLLTVLVLCVFVVCAQCEDLKKESTVVPPLGSEDNNQVTSKSTIGEKRNKTAIVENEIKEKRNKDYDQGGVTGGDVKENNDAQIQNLVSASNVNKSTDSSSDLSLFDQNDEFLSYEDNNEEGSENTSTYVAAEEANEDNQPPATDNQAAGSDAKNIYTYGLLIKPKPEKIAHSKDYNNDDNSGGRFTPKRNALKPGNTNKAAPEKEIKNDAYYKSLSTDLLKQYINKEKETYKNYIRGIKPEIKPKVGNADVTKKRDDQQKDANNEALQFVNNFERTKQGLLNQYIQEENKSSVQYATIHETTGGYIHGADVKIQQDYGPKQKHHKYHKQGTTNKYKQQQNDDQYDDAVEYLKYLRENAHNAKHYKSHDYHYYEEYDYHNDQDYQDDHDYETYLKPGKEHHSHDYDGYQDHYKGYNHNHQAMKYSKNNHVAEPDKVPAIVVAYNHQYPTQIIHVNNENDKFYHQVSGEYLINKDEVINDLFGSDEVNSIKPEIIYVSEDEGDEDPSPGKNVEKLIMQSETGNHATKPTTKAAEGNGNLEGNKILNVGEFKLEGEIQEKAESNYLNARKQSSLENALQNGSNDENISLNSKRIRQIPARRPETTTTTVKPTERRRPSYRKPNNAENQQPPENQSTTRKPVSRGSKRFGIKLSDDDDAKDQNKDITQPTKTFQPKQRRRQQNRTLTTQKTPNASQEQTTDYKYSLPLSTRNKKTTSGTTTSEKPKYRSRARPKEEKETQTNNKEITQQPARLKTRRLERPEPAKNVAAISPLTTVIPPQQNKEGEIEQFALFPKYNADDLYADGLNVDYGKRYGTPFEETLKEIDDTIRPVRYTGEEKSAFRLGRRDTNRNGENSNFKVR